MSVSASFDSVYGTCCELGDLIVESCLFQRRLTRSMGRVVSWVISELSRVCFSIV